MEQAGRPLLDGYVSGAHAIDALLDERSRLVGPSIDAYIRPRRAEGKSCMPQFVIEREMPGVGKLGADDLKGASQGSCTVLRDLGPEIQWVHSYVTDDKIYCVYRAPSEELIRKHAETAGFPANNIAQVRATIDPTTAE